MRSDAPSSKVALLLSGGLDSGILAGHLLRQGAWVQPIYIQSRLVWQPEELEALRSFLASISPRWPRLLELVVLDLPLADLYSDHWSLTGQDPPRAESADEAVYLPGRNVLLLVKAALWCVWRGVDRIALGILGTNPFADATPEFFEQFEECLNRAVAGRLRIVRPFARLTKREVMELGRGLPLELTFSCIAPAAGLHCGQCNKCAERKAAFRLAGVPDLTPYAAPLMTPG